MTTQYINDESSKLVYISSLEEGYTEYIYDNNGNLTYKHSSDNLIANSGFEHTSLGWSYSSPTMFTQDSIVKEGTRSLQFASATPVGQVADSGIIQAVPNTTYTLRGWISDSLSSGVIYMDWLEFDASDQMVVDGDGIFPNGKNQWQYGSVEFTTSPSTVKMVIRVVVEGNATGNGYVDGIVLVKGSKSSLYTTSFERGDANWNYSPAMFTQDSIVKEGARSLQFASTTPMGQVADSRIIQATPSTTHTLSGWISDSLSSGVIYMDWLGFDASGQMVVDGHSILPNGKNQWQYGSVEFTTSPSTVKVVVLVVVEGNATGNGFADGIFLANAL